jgi:hypothetical protein
MVWFPNEATLKRKVKRTMIEVEIERSGVAKVSESFGLVEHGVCRSLLVG